jgi:capsular exopolysaccharide synthesis family protein
MAAAAGLFGLCAPLALLMGLDLRRQLVNGRQTMTDLMIMPVLGSLPLIPKRIMKRLGDGRRPKAVVWRRRLDESLAAVTSLLLRKLEAEGHRVILIASATPGEGKSTLAAQLATSLAESGHSTLLVDFDLRRPMLHRKFNLPIAPGATEVLRQGVELDRAVQTTDVPNLKILTAGGVNTGSLLQDSANGSLRALFVTARANFEIVVVDSAPLLPVVDGRMVGQHTDGAILSVIKDVSKVPQLMTTCNILDDYGIPALGCVVMGDSDDIYYSTYVKNGLEQLQHA